MAVLIGGISLVYNKYYTYPFMVQDKGTCIVYNMYSTQLFTA
jgi:hypothetical protein